MRLATAFLYVVCVADGFAQTSATLDAIRYPPLAEFAVVQGDVLVSGGKVISGLPLLRETALQFHVPQSATKKIEIRQCTDGANPPANRIDSTKIR